MIGKDEEVELPELNKILTKYMTGESKRPLWPYLTEAVQKCLIPLRRRRRRPAVIMHLFQKKYLLKIKDYFSDK